MKKKLFLSNFRLFKFFDKKGIGSLPRIFVSSIVIVTLFYISPAIKSNEAEILEVIENAFQEKIEEIVAINTSG